MNKTFLALLSGASIALTTGAFAESHVHAGMDYYVGAGITYPAGFTDNYTYTDSTAPNGGINYDLNSKDVGGEIFACIEVTRHFGFEGGFSNVGNSTYGTTNTGNTSFHTGTGAGSLKLSDQWNIHLYGTARLPIFDWFSPFVFGGLAYTQSKGVDTFRLNSATTSTTTSWKNHQFALASGAGLQFDFNQFAIRGTYTYVGPSHARNNVITVAHSSTAGENYTHSNPAPTDYLSLDVLYRFNA